MYHRESSYRKYKRDQRNARLKHGAFVLCAFVLVGACVWGWHQHGSSSEGEKVEFDSLALDSAKNSDVKEQAVVTVAPKEYPKPVELPEFDFPPYDGIPLYSYRQQKEYASPLEISLFLAGNFGEPRPNHFHGGLDLKTERQEGKRVLAVADGYVSRLTMNLYGFGNAVWVTHHDGNMSIYAHLREFAPELDSAVVRLIRATQPSLSDPLAHTSRFSPRSGDTLSFYLPPMLFPVRVGQQLALSGNTGNSMAPHLHWELRRKCDDMIIDPMPFLSRLIEDHLAPEVHAAQLYPDSTRGVVNMSTTRPAYLAVRKQTDQPLAEAWGRVGVALWAGDMMDNTLNRMGIYRVELWVEDSLRFYSQMDSLHIEEHPLVNEYGDYAHWQRTHQWYLRSFRPRPNFNLSFCHYDQGGGWVNINEPKDYKFEYVMKDHKGNILRTKFYIKGNPAYRPMISE